MNELAILWKEVMLLRARKLEMKRQIKAELEVEKQRRQQTETETNNQEQQSIHQVEPSRQITMTNSIRSSICSPTVAVPPKITSAINSHPPPAAVVSSINSMTCAMAGEGENRPESSPSSSSTVTTKINSTYTTAFISSSKNHGLDQDIMVPSTSQSESSSLSIFLKDPRKRKTSQGGGGGSSQRQSKMSRGDGQQNFKPSSVSSSSYPVKTSSSSKGSTDVKKSVDEDLMKMWVEFNKKIDFGWTIDEMKTLGK